MIVLRPIFHIIVLSFAVTRNREKRNRDATGERVMKLKRFKNCLILCDTILEQPLCYYIWWQLYPRNYKLTLKTGAVCSMLVYINLKNRKTNSSISQRAIWQRAIWDRIISVFSVINKTVTCGLNQFEYLRPVLISITSLQVWHRSRQ